jgi:C_GCAxxG_C_C family probable redox protein
MSKAEVAEKAFLGGVNCAQAILITYGGQFGLDEKLALRLAAGLGGGIGRTGDVCGAALGACVILSLKNASPEKSADRTVPTDKVKEFLDAFAARVGAVDCLTLLGCSVRTHEGHESARKRNLFTTICPKYVRAAAETLEGML